MTEPRDLERSALAYNADLRSSGMLGSTRVNIRRFFLDDEIPTWVRAMPRPSTLAGASAEYQAEDYLEGTPGDDIIYGGTGNDHLDGGAGNDSLYGEDGNDTLVGGTGADYLAGGTGADYLAGGAGDDTYVFSREDMLIVDGAVDNIVDLQGLNHVVFQDDIDRQDLMLSVGAVAGSVVISVGDGYGLTIGNALSGSVQDFTFADGSTLGMHQLIGASYNANANQASSAANAYLLGGMLNDTISGTGEGATISGGRGNDTLTGGTSARTTFLFELGDGADTINDRGNRIVGGQLMTNTLAFGAGIQASSLQLECTQTGVLTIRIAGTTDAIRLQYFSRTDVLAADVTLDAFRFSDGATLTWQQLVGQLGIDVVNTSTTTSLVGTNVNDRIRGGAQNETISGQAGDDIIYGNGGNDTLDGGAGNDTYVYGRGHGNDIINNTDDAGTVDKLLLDATLSAAEITWYRYDDQLIGRISGSTDEIRVNNFFAGALDLVEFADGASFTMNTLPVASPQTQATANGDVIYGSQSGDVIDGLAGNDTVYGGRGDDAVSGGEGVDTLRGEAGNDTLDGGIGNDILYGGDGNDTLADSVGSNQMYGDAGDDTLLGSGTLDGGIGNDTLIGTGTLIGGYGNDTITGGATSATLNGGADDDILTGGSGTSSMYGGDGNDTLIAGQGASTMRGEAGNDLYIYNVGAGADTIAQADATIGRMDVLRLGAGILPEDVVFQTSVTGDLILRFRQADGTLHPTDVLTLTQFLDSDAAYRKLDRIEFESMPGVFWTTAQIEQMVFTPNDDGTYIRGTQNADTIDALGGNDTLYGGAGDDTLDGGSGNDAVNGGNGNDTLNDNVGSNVMNGDAGNDTLFGTGTLNGGDGNDTLTGGSGSATLNGGAGADTLIAGLGASTMRGDAGNDLYIYNLGSGADTITQSDSAVNRMDVLRLGAGILPENVVFQTSAAGDLILRFRQADGTLHPTDALTLTQFLDSDAATKKLDRIEFESMPGVFWTLAQIEQMAFTPNDDDNYIRGTLNGDTVHALGGNDTVYGGAGNDTLDGGAGYDTLYGGQGNDTLYTGDDSAALYGEAGDDTLVATGGMGTLSGGQGNDTYLIERAAASITLGSQGFETDVLKLGAGIALSDTTYRRSGQDLLLRVYAADGQTVLNQITVTNYFSHLGSVIDEIRFVDDPSVVLRQADVVALSLIGTNENETLSGTLGNDILRGHGGNDILSGVEGDDDLDGGAGHDTLNGGAGNDTYRFGTGSAEDTVWDSGGASDRIELAAGITPDQVALYRIGAANGDSLVLVLNGSNEQLVITRHFAAGDVSRIEEIRFSNGVVWDAAYILANLTNLAGPALEQTGTSGDDTFTVDHSSDAIVEAAGGGSDTVNSYVHSYTLGANVENMNLLGVLNSRAYGNELNNVLTGNGGDNVLSGGAGVDTMSGGAGNDTYYVDQVYAGTWSNSRHGNFQDIVVESAGAGIDTIYATTYSAIMPANVERLILQQMVAQPDSGPVGTDFRRKFIGNDLDNYIDLSAGYETGVGLLIDGGLGADTMLGFGNVTYVVDNVGDAIVDTDGNGSVTSWIDYTLGEGLHGLGLLGSADLEGAGNADANSIVGNSGDNVLLGLDGDDDLSGGAGNDTLVGGNGADYYRYGATDGLDTIDNGTSDAADDRLVIDASSSAFSFSRSNDDLLISNNASAATDAVRVTNWFLAEQWQLDVVRFAGLVDYTNEDINAMFESGMFSAPASSVAQLAPDDATLELQRLVQAMSHFGGDRQSVDADLRVQRYDSSDWLYAGRQERSGFEHHSRMPRADIA